VVADAVGLALRLCRLVAPYVVVIGADYLGRLMSSLADMYWLVVALQFHGAPFGALPVLFS